MKTICLVIPYFGKWPRWFNFFLESCKYNPTVDWLFYTDCVVPKKSPKNVRFVKAKFSDFTQLASEKLEQGLNLSSPYKLCDLKPAYGVIFEDYLKKYDFWGCGDIDLIYGDIRKFITEDLLEKHDIINCQKEYISAHFLLFKNCDRINRLYAKGDYKRVFRSKEYYNFDESNFIFDRSVLSKKPNTKRFVEFVKNTLNSVIGKQMFYIPPEAKSMSYIIKKLETSNLVKVYSKTVFRGDTGMVKKDIFGRWKTTAASGWKYYWNKGKLIDTKNDEEILYFHFQTLKNYKKFLVPNYQEGSFFITPNGFLIRK